MKSLTRADRETAAPRNDIHRTNSTASTRSEGSLPNFLLSSANQRDSTLKVQTPGSTISAPGTISYEPERRRIVWEALQDTIDEHLFEDDDTEGPSSAGTSPIGDPSFYPWGPTFQSIESVSRERSNTLPSRQNVQFQSPSIRALWDTEAPESSGQNALLSKLEQFGSPCQIEWLTTQNLPFDEIRGIQNAWNNNKDVHVARNVTAVEPRAASALLQFWKIRIPD